ncbi:MAG: 4'-phosphopantetheinyl transferase superfamily protein [Desulfomonilaceae bacterium]|nr:4'-phosphopantetheinyl transferase superfamily protein [Desulfomonilaceae bacterium]
MSPARCPIDGGYESVTGIGTIRSVGGIPVSASAAVYLGYCEMTDVPGADRDGPTDLRDPVPCEQMRRNRKRAGLLLAAELMDTSPFGNNGLPTGSRHCRGDLQIASDEFGAPQLIVRGAEGPGISFSYSGNTIWAALCSNDRRCGIDLARTDEFVQGYPFHRAFHGEEFRSVLPVSNGNIMGAAALLWSAKEATVKALGCAFHLIDPLQVHVRLRGSSRGEVLLVAQLDGSVEKKLFGGWVSRIFLTAKFLGHGWVSVAVTNRNRLP